MNILALLYTNNKIISVLFVFITVLAIVCLGTKTLVVHGQNECDIPTQLPVHEDTQFEALLKVIVIAINLFSVDVIRSLFCYICTI